MAKQGGEQMTNDLKFVLSITHFNSETMSQEEYIEEGIDRIAHTIRELGKKHDHELRNWIKSSFELQVPLKSKQYNG